MSDTKKILNQDPANKHLSSDVAAVYKAVDWPTDSPGQVFGKYGPVNLKTLTLKQAEILVKQKFPKLQKK